MGSYTFYDAWLYDYIIFGFIIEEDLDCFNPVENTRMEDIEDIDEMIYRGRGGTCIIPFVLIRLMEYLNNH